MTFQPVKSYDLPASQSSHRGGYIASGVVMLAAYITVFMAPDFEFELNRILVLLGLGFIYTINITLGERWLELHPRPLYKAAYFVVQIWMGGYLIYLGKGGMWLVLLPVVSTAVQRLPRPLAVLTILAIWAAQVLPFYWLYGQELMLAWAMPFLAAIVFVAVFTLLMVNEQRARAELAAANQKLREYSSQIEALAVVQERNRLAREIHDGLGHYLTAINIQIKAAQALAGQDPVSMQTALRDAQTLTQDALADVRRSISSLRADPTTSQPLPEVLGGLLKEVSASGTAVDFQVSGSTRPLSPQIEFALYRLVQEGLTNVRKHAHATQVRMHLEYLPQGVRVSLQDNGLGALQTEGGFGLMGVRERVELLQGHLDIHTAPGGGFRLEAELPAPSGLIPEV